MARNDSFLGKIPGWPFQSEGWNRKMDKKKKPVISLIRKKDSRAGDGLEQVH